MSSYRRKALLGWKIFLTVLALAMMTAGCHLLDSGFVKVPETEVDVNKKKRAWLIGTKILDSQKAGKFKPLGKESTLAMQKGLSVEKQKESYESIKGMYGDFVAMDYAETWKPKDGSLMMIYRFKGRFSKSDARPEIRVVMDGNDKLAGLWLKPWNDDLR